MSLVILYKFLIFICFFLPTSFFVFGETPKNYEPEENFVSSALIGFWQKVISPADGPRSPSFPTGSRYGRDAFQKYEFFTAMVLTADRLVHESDVPLRGIIRIGSHEKFYDPLIENTYWWDEEYEQEEKRKISALKQKIKKYESVYSDLD